MPKKTLREIAYIHFRRVYGPEESKRKTDEYIKDSLRKGKVR